MSKEKSKFGLKELLKEGLVSQAEALETIRKWKREGILYSDSIERWVRNYTPIKRKKHSN